MRSITAYTAIKTINVGIVLLTIYQLMGFARQVNTVMSKIVTCAPRTIIVPSAVMAMLLLLRFMAMEPLNTSVPHLVMYPSVMFVNQQLFVSTVPSLMSSHLMPNLATAQILISPTQVAIAPVQLIFLNSKTGYVSSAISSTVQHVLKLISAPTAQVTSLYQTTNVSAQLLSIL